MHPPHDEYDHHGQARAQPRPAQGLKDTAGWQALYQAMLGHITGNVEVWLRDYLAGMMASGQGPAAAHMRPPKAGRRSSS